MADGDDPSDLQRALTWIGFDDQNHRDMLEAELTDLTAMRRLSQKDIRNLRDGFATRTQQEGRFYFGLNRTKLLQDMVGWLADLDRCNEDVDMSDFEDGEDFRDELDASRERAEVRESEEDTMESRAKESSPGKLTGDAVWDDWEAKLENMLAIIIGCRGVPLAYVIRELDEPPDEEIEYESFTAKCIAQCTLEGPKFEADARKVHQIINSCVIGEHAEQWTKPHRKKQNGRIDIKALREHYRGKGNQTRRITDAERLRDTLHYKGESSMPFATFLSKCQKMFNLYEQTEEPMTEAAKLRFLFEKTMNTELRPTVESLKAQISTQPDIHTFASAANHMAANVKPKTVRGLSALATTDLPAAITKNGKIHTGYYKNWLALSPEERKLVTAERERLGISSNKQGGGKENAGNGSKKWKNKIKAISKKLEKARSQISALKRKDDGASSDEDEEDEDVSAGNAFGGRNEKERSKPKKKKSKT